MTTTKIESAKQLAAVKFDLAKQIRELLDQARKSYGPAAWDADDMESEVLNLVTEE